tara:strand:+ start:270 stop:731 length:462 start_codon:yes stop_codon:yes gene_type:complete
MNKHTQKYQGIINDLIKKSFPELKTKKFKVFEFDITKFSGGYFPIINLIGIHKKHRDSSNKVLKGLFVHELCHAEIVEKRSLLKNMLIGIAYWFVDSTRKKEENETDKLIIKKGYSRELFKLTKLREEEGKEYSKYYLSPQEIKSYAKKIGKW